MRWSTRSALVVLGCLGFAERAQAETEVPAGDYPAGTWTEAGSPYRVTGGVFFNALVVEAGTQVLVSEGARVAPPAKEPREAEAAASGGTTPWGALSRAVVRPQALAVNLRGVEVQRVAPPVVMLVPVVRLPKRAHDSAKVAGVVSREGRVRTPHSWWFWLAWRGFTCGAVRDTYGEPRAGVLSHESLRNSGDRLRGDSTTAPHSTP